MSNEQREDIIRVMRIVEYVGPRSAVEANVAKSIQGEKKFGGRWTDNYANASKGLSGVAFGEYTPEITIRATTLGTFPEILESAVLIQALKGEPTEKDLRIAELEKELKEATTYRQASQYANTRMAGAQNALLGSQPAPRDMQYLQDQIDAKSMSIIERFKSRFGL